MEFAADKFDRRLKRIVITKAGMDAAEQTKARLDGMEERLTAGFSPEELTALHALLDRLVENAKQAGGRCRDREGD